MPITTPLLVRLVANEIINQSLIDAVGDEGGNEAVTKNVPSFQLFPFAVLENSIKVIMRFRAADWLRRGPSCFLCLVDTAAWDVIEAKCVVPSGMDGNPFLKGFLQTRRQGYAAGCMNAVNPFSFSNENFTAVEVAEFASKEFAPTAAVLELARSQHSRNSTREIRIVVTPL